MVSTLTRSLLFILAPLFLKASCPVQAATLPIDLSVDFEQAPLYNANEGSDVLIDYAQTQPDIKGFIVIENGEVVSEYYDDSHDETTLGEIWSCTKSWTSLFFGMLEKEGLISTSDRLVDVRDGGFWNNVGDAFYRKELPIDLILTMTAGLRTPLRFFLDLIFGVTPWGGISAFDSLTYPDLIPSETGTTFEYVGVANLLSYVVREASGLTPEEFANAKLFPFLGITASDYEWEKTNDGTNTAWHGLSMNVPAMAKLGQLYLQNGFHNSETTVLNEDWVERTITGTEPNPAYGYHWWISEPNLRPHRFCAEGAGEQRICVDQELNRVYAVLSYDDSSEAAFVLWELVAMLSFSEPSNGQVKTLPEYPTGIAIEESVREKFEKAMAEERKLIEK